jgi:hypothetical protein
VVDVREPFEPVEPSDQVALGRAQAGGELVREDHAFIQSD